MNDDQTQNVVPQSPSEPTVEPPIPPTDTTPTDMPPVATEAPRDAVTPVPTEDQNGAVKQEDNRIPEPVKPTVISESPVAQATVPAPSFFHDLLLRARAKIQDRKRKKLDKIMAKFMVRNKISNDDVQKLLYVSDATATRYLTALEREGKIKQAGRTGKSVFYTKI